MLNGHYSLPSIIYYGLICAVLSGCTSKGALFKKVDSDYSHVDFINHIQDTDTLNILDYLYYYNGGGVSVGDINNDNLPDIYFVSNQDSNRLYLNKGNFVFEDITARAGIEAMGGWKTGSTMVDINSDGLLDIYVSKVSDHKPFGKSAGTVYFKNSSNKLFINQGNLRFTEESDKWGLALKGYNTQAIFFDYDRDRDLDMYQLQHSIHQTDVYGDTALRKKFSDISGGKMLRNDGNGFTDVTTESGIISSALGYGLGVAVSDFNNDGWDDLYVGNDFHENDYYYLNQGNGTFKESSKTAFGHTSNFSMGNDAADINNDGWTDLFTLDMLPSDEKVLKSSVGDKPLDLYENQYTLGYHYQTARNCLQLNTGAGNTFSDIALYSGVAATDWSWSVLLADYDLDGLKDIFVTNGIKRRLNDLDYIKFLSSQKNRTGGVYTRSADKEILSKQPEGKWHNYLFKGSDSLVFQDMSREWGMSDINLSNGAAYADLDVDGDLDLVTNNMNEPAGVYKNQAREDGRGNYVTVSFKGNEKNTYGIGAKAFVCSGNKVLYQQFQPTRGFLSNGFLKLHFGIGKEKKIDSVIVIWPLGKYQTIRNPVINTHLVVDETNADTLALPPGDFIRELFQINKSGLFTNISGVCGIDYKHRENDFDDFNRQWFIPHKLSTSGPALATGDINGDGFQDVFFGGGKNQSAVLYIQMKDGTFSKTNQPAIQSDSASEDVDAAFFDADADQDLDLYVVSGGNEYFPGTLQMNDRLYLNDGLGNFSRGAVLPVMHSNKSAVTGGDFDSDGDIDLFICGRSDVKVYGIIPRSYLLQNNGKGNFQDVTKSSFENSGAFGMLTDACWADVDGDKDLDLIMVGEWMPITIYINEKGKLALKKSPSLKQTSGWWQTIEAGDIDKDGDIDFVAGNYGLNSKLSPSTDYALKMYVADFDKNGSPDQLMAVEKVGKYYPFLGKEDLERQLPYLKKEYLSYASMAGKTVDEVFGKQLAASLEFSAETFASLVFYNTGDGNFTYTDLPMMLQTAPVFSVLLEDFDNDSRTDILGAGNFFGVMPYEGRYDALFPTVAIQIADKKFKASLPYNQELQIGGEYRKGDVVNLATGRKAVILVKNNDRPVVLEY